VRTALCAFALTVVAIAGFAAEDKKPERPASRAEKNQAEVQLLLRRYLAAQQYHAAQGQKYAPDFKKLVGKSSKKSPLPWYRLEQSFADAVDGGKILHGYKFVRLEKSSDGKKLGAKRHAILAVPGKPGIGGQPSFIAFASRDTKIRGGDVWVRQIKGKAPAMLPASLKKSGWKLCRSATKAKPEKLTAKREKKIRELIALLGNDSFATRERASAELKKLVKLASPFLKKTAEESKDAEVVSRARTILRGATSSSPSESRGVGSCRTYCSAQTMYKRNDWDGDGDMEYASRFTRLITTQDGNGDPIQLLHRTMKDAVTPKKSRQGYFFMDIRTINGKAIDWLVDYGLCAVPAKYGGATRKTFIVATNGTVFGKDTGGKPVFDYPADPTAKGWVVAE
jgi:Protein of unknown function (DUF2950)